jgi:hypothetical protein
LWSLDKSLLTNLNKFSPLQRESEPNYQPRDEQNDLITIRIVKWGIKRSAVGYS